MTVFLTILGCFALVSGGLFIDMVLNGQDALDGY